MNIVRCLMRAALLFALICSSARADEFAYTVAVPAGRVECFYHEIDREKYVSFELDYQVISGGGADISFHSVSPKGARIINDIKRHDGMHRFNLNDPKGGRGDYAFCFDNSFSLHAEKRVFFEFFLMDAAGQFLNGFGDKTSVGADILRTLDTHFDYFQKVTANVKNNLNKVERIQRQYSSLELADRTALETSFEMINFWSIVHLIVMVFSVSLQIFMVRCLFEDDSRVGRLLRKGGLKD